VAELGLALGGIPQKVVHLTAANEHRVNFSLTGIASSVQAGVGYKLVLPGVHANVGGSYGEVTDEEERLLHARLRAADFLGGREREAHSPRPTGS